MPAYFGVLEREATRRAGRIAGLNVLDLLAEPVAAALGYHVLAAGAGVGTSSSTTSAVAPSIPPLSVSTDTTSRSSAPTATARWAGPTGTTRSASSC